ncbi:DNA damage-inducible protein I [Klebsiella pneumoniae]|uniref:DinI-like family protein n=1 Tax=Klebsiella TaxID=570 RepID=UPI000C7CF00A|nr:MULTISPECIES: DinI-like family protein [Klebsiella]HDS9974756.1 DinI-like family protein [Klebsiella pneumoniae subsp. pneumoniae]AXS14781.1 DNA damage-inducible protein I [Klebsiella pneumoniae]AYJ99891.1 DNA damage-inducible protein I [Klebsiella pneumoniae]EIW5936968.1 DinI-like family protein [Klebsiella pneumoniae]EIX9598497.1 DinI-like family protein [Klebsiella pneumoniae]
MKVKLSIDYTKKIFKGSVQVMEQQLLSGFQNQFGEYSLVIRRTGTEGFTVYGGKKEVKNKIEEILLQTWKSADDWFI